GPVAGDDIVGYRRNDGILVIHKRGCPQIKESGKFAQVKWGTTPSEPEYVIIVEALNRPGLASDISTILALLGIDMPGFSAYSLGIAEGIRFYGREVECERISSLLHDQALNRTILLWGQRRIGKTSFVLRLKEQAQGGYLPVYIDMQGLKDSSTTQFLYRLMS